MCEIKLLKSQMDCRLCGIVIVIISVFRVAVAMNISVSDLMVHSTVVSPILHGSCGGKT